MRREVTVQIWRDAIKLFAWKGLIKKVSAGEMLDSVTRRCVEDVTISAGPVAATTYVYIRIKHALTRSRSRFFFFSFSLCRPSPPPSAKLRTIAHNCVDRLCNVNVVYVCTLIRYHERMREQPRKSSRRRESGRKCRVVKYGTSVLLFPGREMTLVDPCPK